MPDIRSSKQCSHIQAVAATVQPYSELLIASGKKEKQLLLSGTALGFTDEQITQLLNLGSFHKENYLPGRDSLTLLVQFTYKVLIWPK